MSLSRGLWTAECWKWTIYASATLRPPQGGPTDTASREDGAQAENGNYGASPPQQPLSFDMTPDSDMVGHDPSGSLVRNLSSITCQRRRVRSCMCARASTALRGPHDGPEIQEEHWRLDGREAGGFSTRVGRAFPEGALPGFMRSKGRDSLRGKMT